MSCFFSADVGASKTADAPVVVTSTSEAAVLIAAGFDYETLSDSPLRLRFPAAARARLQRRRRIGAGFKAAGYDAAVEKRMLPKHVLDRM